MPPIYVKFNNYRPCYMRIMIKGYKKNESTLMSWSRGISLVRNKLLKYLSFSTIRYNEDISGKFNYGSYICVFSLSMAVKVNNQCRLLKFKPLRMSIKFGTQNGPALSLEVI